MTTILGFVFAFLGTAGAHAAAAQIYTLNQPVKIRYNKHNVLEVKIELPVGSQVLIPGNYQISFLDDRADSGLTERSSTGFATPITIMAVPDSAGIPKSKLDKINSTSGGLYVTATLLADMAGADGDFNPVKKSPLGAGYLTNYRTTGQPKFSYSKAIRKRFGASVDRAVDPNTQTAAERLKWARIMSELHRASDRTVATPKSLIMIDKTLGTQESIQYEKTGQIPLNGAWTIAVQGTAIRHGFANVPCAEFVSEQLREAYQRAGYDVTEDFNDHKGNRLIYTNTASVQGLTVALDKAGWVPWDGAIYRPEPGAPLMNGGGESPGHAYVNAGEDGRLILDNGSPQGRDLGVTSRKIIELMYQSGVFFLPPGINPRPW